MLRALLTWRGPSRGPWVAPGPGAAAEVEHPQPHPQGGSPGVLATSAGLGHLPEPGGPQASLEKPSSAPDPARGRAGSGGCAARISKGLLRFPSEVVRFPAEGFSHCLSSKGN